MSNAPRRKFASQADPEVLDAFREIAKEDGRQFQAVLEDAMVEYLERRRDGSTRSSVLKHFHASLKKKSSSW